MNSFTQSFGAPDAPLKYTNDLSYQELFPLLLAYREMELDPLVCDGVERAIHQFPRWMAHLKSIEDLDLERLAARYDAERLKAAMSDDPTPFCIAVSEAAQGGGSIFTPLLRGDDNAGNWTRSEWARHTEECVYCRRMRRRANAEIQRQDCLPDEPLLRDWLLRDYLGDLVDQRTLKILEYAVLEESRLSTLLPRERANPAAHARTLAFSAGSEAPKVRLDTDYAGLTFEIEDRKGRWVLHLEHGEAAPGTLLQITRVNGPGAEFSFDRFVVLRPSFASSVGAAVDCDMDGLLATANRIQVRRVPSDQLSPKDIEHLVESIDKAARSDPASIRAWNEWLDAVRRERPDLLAMVATLADVLSRTRPSPPEMLATLPVSQNRADGSRGAA